ncbi:MAG: N-acetylmuramoyl-L-alanine amidase [Clostridia bacterium]|nr:N-acetylmuramoyl-L-alanine amidase [Clostridia bacterium]
MKNIFVTIKKKWILSVVAICLVMPVLAGVFATQKASRPKPEYTIVIDAGHGGRDGGAVGKTTGVSESELNLQFALTLKAVCEEFGIGVVMTRSDMKGLYDENASNKKRSEMEKRREIINSSNADLMISLHMNSFPLSSCEGAYVFYGKGCEEGERLAGSISSSLSKSFDSARKIATIGDYYVLNYSSIPSALVECGFLSNPEEERLLASEQYQKEFCYSLLAGILSYFEMR